jgi:predicted transcriptional regulator
MIKEEVKNTYINIRISSTLKKELADMAEVQNRNLSNMVEHILKKEVTKHKATRS